jgi:formylglycine-generating enzyme
MMMRVTLSMPVTLLVICAAALGAADAAGAQVSEGRPAARASAGSHAAVSNPFVAIPAGQHARFYGDGTVEAVAAFQLQRDLVSVAEYRRFVEAQPRWQRGRIPGAFADAGYLRDWAAALPADDAPVVNVSWFAARAYCNSVDARLPTVLEWEYVAAASSEERDATGDTGFKADMLRQYTRARPSALPRTGSGAPNWYGIRDLHGPVREWVLDFNSIMVTDDSRSASGVDRGLYCAAGAVATRDASDYAAYLRYALRASLSARSSVSNVGFRCAR